MQTKIRKPGSRLFAMLVAAHLTLLAGYLVARPAPTQAAAPDVADRSVRALERIAEATERNARAQGQMANALREVARACR